MSNITDELTGLIKITEEPNNIKYHRFDDGSAEIEVLEFLYALVKLTKPTEVLETGTYFGLSGAYIALGLRDNGFGHLDSIEWEKQHVETAKKLWNQLGLENLITEYHMSSLDFQPTVNYDFVLLDTEPQLRFLELDKFWNYIKPGSIIAIHDLSWDLGIGAPQFWLNKELLDKRIKNKEVQVINFMTPRGFTILRKLRDIDEITKIIK